jgi:hypothetical protein
MKVRRMVLDILKPHKPPIHELTIELAENDGVDGVNSSLIEVDEEVKNFKVTVEGDMEVQDVKQVIKDFGASIHSVDEVAAGEKIVEKIRTPQD